MNFKKEIKPKNSGKKEQKSNALKSLYLFLKVKKRFLIVLKEYFH